MLNFQDSEKCKEILFLPIQPIKNYFTIPKIEEYADEGELLYTEH